MAAFLLALNAARAPAQLSRGGSPLVVNPVKSESVWVVPAGVDREYMMLEDRWAAVTGKKSQRIAKEFPCELNPSVSGQWQTHSDGTGIWRLGIRGEGARALGLVFNRYALKPGVRLFVFDPERKMILGAYTDLNNKPSGMLPVSYLKGEELIVQLEVPAGTDDFGDLQIGSVRYAYRPVFGGETPSDYGMNLSGSCNLDINCSQGDDWQQVKRSVVKLVSGETCTGVLVNNTAEDEKPYILTAAHCVFDKISGQYHNITFYFNFESSGCGTADTIPYQSISVAELIATGDTSEITVDADSLDFALLELSVAPPDSFGIYFAGWNRTSSAALHTTTIHHPSGDVKKISLDNDPPLSDYSKDHSFEELVYSSFWQIEQWDAGTTEGGSSGCPLFDENQQIVGTLTGGEASCLNPVNDYFTRFDYAWDYYPDSLRQLKYWLDPGNTGSMSVSGLDPLSGRDEPERNNFGILLYPNPATDQLILVTDRLNGRPFEISIISATGAVLYQSGPQDREEISIRVGEYPPGIYLVRVKTDRGTGSARFIIQ